MGIVRSRRLRVRLAGVVAALLVPVGMVTLVHLAGAPPPAAPG